MNQKSKLNNSQKKFVLLQFTKELIKHSAEGEVFELKNVLKKESKEREENIKKRKLRFLTNSHNPPQNKRKKLIETKRITPEEEIKSELKNFSSSSYKLNEVEIMNKPLRPQIKKMSLSPIIVPKSKLPPRLQYLKPTPTNFEIDLGKLNPLIKDPLVKKIECIGVNKNIIVSGMIGRKKTDIILNREEVEQIIKIFSETAKIPIHEGVFKVVLGKLILSAVISNIIGSKFIIKKMIYNPGFK
jgi:CRISPR/Cas system-associated protein Cas7 (RAMP superfamily)|tara:strand:+ start:1409 stop:2137 length:729 start_codon:yes stop_codon:yes gene_type:complete